MTSQSYQALSPLQSSSSPPGPSSSNPRSTSVNDDVHNAEGGGGSSRGNAPPGNSATVYPIALIGSSSRSSRSNLNNPSERERWHLGSSFFRSSIFGITSGNSSRVVSSFRDYDEPLLESLQQAQILSFLPVLSWLEKIVLVIDFLQVFGIYWVAAQPWPWPYLWTIYTRPLLYGNIDIFSTFEKGALAGQTSSVLITKWGQMHNYVHYAIVFAGVALLLWLGLLCTSYKMDFYGKPFAKYQHHLFGGFYVASYLLFLPCSLAVLRLYYCEDGVLSADPSLTCLSMEHLIYGGVSLLSWLPMFVLLPFISYQLVRKNLIYHNGLDHEKKLQIWEIGYMLQLDDFWLKEHVYLLASFRLNGSYYYFHMLLFKAILVLLFIFVRHDYVLQAGCMLLLTLVFLTMYILVFAFPFRNVSSNGMLMAVFMMWIVNISFGFANSCQVQNAVMVASTETVFLASFHAVGMSILVGTCLFVACNSQFVDWPTTNTFLRIYTNPTLLAQVAHWIEILRESKTIALNFLLSAYEIADLPLLEEGIRQIRQCLMKAKQRGSIFEHLLSDQLECMLIIHSHALPFALRKSIHWDESYRQSVVHKTFSRRKQQYQLMNPKKRRILFKLLAYKTFREKTSTKFSMEVVEEYQREERTQQYLLLQNKRKQQYALQQRLLQQLTSNHMSAFDRFKYKLLLTIGWNEALKRLLEENFADIEKLLALEKEGFTLDADGNQIPIDHEAMEAKRQQSIAAMMKELEAAAAAAQEVLQPDGKEGDDADSTSSGAKKHFDDFMVEEARKMIARLQQRTELALNKHSQATKRMFEQQKINLIQSKYGNKIPTLALLKTSGGEKEEQFAQVPTMLSIEKAKEEQATGSGKQPQQQGDIETGSIKAEPSEATDSKPSLSLHGGTPSLHNLLNASSNTLGKLGLTKISTMELIKETVDEEEQKDLEDLFHLWDEAINLYETEQFPGDYEKLNNEVENWYAYRGLVSQRLDIIDRMLEEQARFIDEIGADEVIEEGSDEDEHNSPRPSHKKDDFGDEVEDEDDDDDEESPLLLKGPLMPLKEALSPRLPMKATRSINSISVAMNQNNSLSTNNSFMDHPLEAEDEIPPIDTMPDWN